MFFTKVIWVLEESDVEVFGDGGVVRAGVGEDSVILGDEGFGEKLPEVAETNDGDFELGGLTVAMGDLGFEVEGLGGI